MRVCAEIKCYHCSYVSGQVCGDASGPLRLDELRPNPDFKGTLPKPGEPLRCFRCGGPIYLNDVHKEKPAPRPTEELFRRRGRKKKVKVAAA